MVGYTVPHTSEIEHLTVPQKKNEASYRAKVTYKVLSKKITVYIKNVSAIKITWDLLRKCN